MDEIVRLCEGYSIVSEYASFLVLENDAEYKRWKIDRRNATRVQRDRKAQLALRQTFDQLQQQAGAQLGPQNPTDTLLASAAESQSGSRPSGLPNRNGATPLTINSQATPSQPSRSTDLNVPSTRSRSPGYGGGGAIDPLTAMMALGLAGLGFAARRRRRK